MNENKVFKIWLFSIVAMGIMYLCSESGHIEIPTPIFIAACLAVIILSILWAITQAKVNEKQKELQKERAIAAANNRFYEECKKNGIYNLNSIVNKEKAKIIAEQLGCRFTEDIEEVWRKSELLEIQRLKLKEENEKNEKFQKLKDTEAKKHKKYIRYAEYVGRDKTLKMLADQKWNLEKQKEALNNKLKGLDSVLASTQEKEIDWALHGGIASGIAGGAAGLATAMEKQAKNAQIREQNQARLKAFAPVYTQSFSSINNQIKYLNKDISELNEEIHKAKLKLVDTPDESELIKKIYFSDTYVEISETGAFTVSTSVYQPYSIRIFDEVIAVIDGSISADLYQNNNKVGSAILVLPLHGIKKQSRVEGICLSGAKQDVPYEVKFTPHHLWTIEK